MADISSVTQVATTLHQDGEAKQSVKQEAKSSSRAKTIIDSPLRIQSSRKAATTTPTRDRVSRALERTVAEYGSQRIVRG